jgi:hypothetical protein
VNTEPVDLGRDPALRAGGASLPIAAERPDAAPMPGDDAVRMVVHFVALVAIVALLAYCVIWAPRRAVVPAGGSGSAIAIPFGAKGAA